MNDALPIHCCEPLDVLNNKIPESFQFETHEAYRIRADGTVYRFRYHTAIRPQSMCDAYDKDKLTVELDADGIYCARNFQGGIEASVKSGHFRDFQNVWMSQPPLWFDTHSMDKYGQWTMKIRQKHKDGRVRLSIFNENGFGFRVRIKSGHYPNIASVIEEYGRSHKLETSEHSYHKTVQIKEIEKVVYREVVPNKVLSTAKDYVRVPVPAPMLPPQFLTERKVKEATDLTTILQIHNDAALERLGNFRSKPPVYDNTNVVKIEDWVSQLEEPTEEAEEINPELEALLSKLA